MSYLTNAFVAPTYNGFGHSKVQGTSNNVFGPTHKAFGSFSEPILNSASSTLSKQTISLTQILQNNREAINQLNRGLITRGYALVEMPSDLVQQVDDCLSTLETFFARDKSFKKGFAKAPIFGYFDVTKKESFRVMTGPRLNEHRLPIGFEAHKDLALTLDQIMHTVALVSGLFPCLMQRSKEDDLDIPLFNVKKRWGMFDVALYQRDQKGDKGSNLSLPIASDKVECQEHYDPGLLSISVRSTQPGLELKDEFNRWIPMRNYLKENKNIAIIWAGNAASVINPQVKRCVHRVVCNSMNDQNNSMMNLPENPRIAIWYEICTADQEHKELYSEASKNDLSDSLKMTILKTSPRPNLPSEVRGWTRAGSTAISHRHQTRPTSPIRKSSDLQGMRNRPDRGVEIAKKFEDNTGIPMSKSGLPLGGSRPAKKELTKPDIPISQLTGLPMFSTMNSYHRFFQR